LAIRLWEWKGEDLAYDHLNSHQFAPKAVWQRLVDALTAATEGSLHPDEYFKIRKATGFSRF
jgi:hypothetical protein